MVSLDEDALFAAADLVGRTGGVEFEVGYLDEEPGSPWYAHVKFRGGRVTAEGAGPVEAAEALARRLLEGGRCRCGKLVALSDDGAMIYAEQTMTDGSTWGPEQAVAAGQCRWTRMGRVWVSACSAGTTSTKSTSPRSQPRRKRPRRRR
jgi:hypothetical protein